MKFLILTISVCLLSFSVIAKEKTKEWSLNGRQSFYGYSVEGERARAQVMGVGLDLLGRRQISPSFSFQFDAGVRLENGSHKSLDIAEFSPNQQVLLHEGTLHFTPINWLKIKAGGINQRHFASPLLIDSVVFVGVSEEVRFEFGDYAVYINAQQLIPNNRNLSTRLDSVDEGTPRFLSETLGLDLGGDLVSLKLAASLFSFQKLSSSVAHQSRFIGNSVRGLGPDSAQFDYGFIGRNLRAELVAYLTENFSLHLEGHTLFNRKAPDDRNQAHWVKGGFTFNQWAFFGEWFRAESDATVAFYNQKFLGHLNRKGFAFGSHLVRDWGEIELRAIRAEALTPFIFQSRSDALILSYQKAMDLF